MIYVLVVFALGTLVAAIKARDRAGRIFFACCFALNAAAALMMAKDSYQYAWRLAPNDGIVEPAYRR